MEANLQEDFISIGEVKLHYLEWRGKGIPILFLCGMFQNAYGFSRLASRLSRNCRVIALTRRGNGRSGQPEDGYDIETLTNDIHGFLSKMKLSPVNLVGWSFAGMELTTFASKYPEHVNKMVYLDAAYDYAARSKLWEQDPLSDFYRPVPDYARESIESYVSYILENMISPQIPSENRDSDSLRRAILEDVEIQPDGSVVERRRDSTVAMLRETISSFTPDYSGILAPSLAIYARHGEYPDKPNEVPKEIMERADDFWMNEVEPSKTASIIQFQTECRLGTVLELADTVHALFAHRDDEVFESISSFFEEAV